MNSATAKVPINYLKRVIKEYAASDAGKADIKEQIGVTYDPKFTKGTAKRYVELLRHNIYVAIRERIESFSPASISCSEVRVGTNGRFYADIILNAAALRRESLYPEKYPEGVDNIVLHFVHGWHAKNYAYGVWRDRSSFTVSRKDKEPDSFLEDVVNEFNSAMGEIAIAYIDPKYKL